MELIYKNTKQKMPLLGEEFDFYSSSGTSSAKTLTLQDFNRTELTSLLIKVIDQITLDWGHLRKNAYCEFESPNGLVIKDLDMALAYSNIHDGIHIGTIRTLLTLLEKR